MKVILHCAKCGKRFKWSLKDFEYIITLTANEDGSYTDKHEGCTVKCKCKCESVRISQEYLEKIVSVKV